MRAAVLPSMLMVLTIARAQDITYLRSAFQQQRFQEILRPLATFRDGLTNSRALIAEETDYMLACTLCALDRWRADGCRYAYNLNPVLRVNGRTVRAPEEFRDCCRRTGLPPPCAGGVTGRGDSKCAGGGGQFDSRSNGDIREAILRSDVGSQPPVYGRPTRPITCAEVSQGTPAYVDCRRLTTEFTSRPTEVRDEVGEAPTGYTIRWPSETGERHTATVTTDIYEGFINRIGYLACRQVRVTGELEKWTVVVEGQICKPGNHWSITGFRF
jgi:hypothetical protein